MLHLSSAGRQRMGFAEPGGVWARRFGRQSIQRAKCVFLPVTIWRVLLSHWPFTLTQQNLPETWITLFRSQNAATESGNAGMT